MLEKPKTRLAVGVGCLALMAGCVYLPPDGRYEGPKPVPDATLTALQPAIPPQEPQISQIESTRTYTLHRVRFPGLKTEVGNHELVLDYFRPRHDEPVPAVLVLPIFGGKNKVANFFSAFFAAHGLAAVVVHRQEKYKDTEDVDTLNRAFKQIVLDHRLAVDWIQTRPEIDGNRIGLFGVSAGAIKGSLVYALEPRIDTAVLALVGGYMAGILARSAEKGIVKRREAVMKKHGLTADDIEAGMREAFDYDPLKFAAHMDARKALLVLACFDAVVPFGNGLELRKAMGYPGTVFLPTGHYTAVLYLPVLQHLALHHLKANLR